MADRKANAYFRFALALARRARRPGDPGRMDGEKKPEISHPFRIEVVDDETGAACRSSSSGRSTRSAM